MPLKPLHDAGRLRRVVATSFQAVSGAGVNGIEELREQTLAWARGEAITPRYFPHQIAFNVIPHIDRFGDNGYTGEEMKLVNEVRKILELPDLPVSPTTVRVPVFTAHSIAVNAETEEKVDARARARGVRAVPRAPALGRAGREPLPDAGRRSRGRTTASWAAIREDLSLPNALNFWVVGDQLRKGAATERRADRGAALSGEAASAGALRRDRCGRPARPRLRRDRVRRLAVPAGRWRPCRGHVMGPARASSAGPCGSSARAAPTPASTRCARSPA